LPKTQKWCENHGYGEGINYLIKDFKDRMDINSDEAVIIILNNAHKLSNECGISIQEVLMHLIFLREQWNEHL
jgi:hypothetical protein